MPAITRDERRGVLFLITTANYLWPIGERSMAWSLMDAVDVLSLLVINNVFPLIRRRDNITRDNKFWYSLLL